jgi:cell division protein FtsI/penicillin-binding protein 2
MTLALSGRMARGGVAGELNYLALDARTRGLVESRWLDATTPIPVGSLVKPFLALAYGRAFPEFECRGAASRCWKPGGHGSIQFSSALAQSCNAYFLHLASMVDANALRVTAAKFGIAPPSVESLEARIGLGNGWKIAPLALVKAYLELAARRGEPNVDLILAGLALAAESGTAKAFGTGVLAKTGTAECVAPRRDSGDGLAVGLEPAEAPRFAVLVRIHNVPGAAASKTAARILREIRGAA